MIYYEPERVNPQNGIYHQHNRGLICRQHLHNSFELIYVYEGAISVEIDDRAFSVRMGEAVLIFPNQIHTISASKSSRSYLCVFQNSLVGEFYRRAKNSVAECPVFSISDVSMIDRLTTADRSRYLLKANLYELIHLFEQSSGAYTLRHSKPIEHIGQILTFIAEHHEEQITMQDAARAIGYDHHYLSNLLQKSLRTTFRALLNEYRVSHAQYALLTSHDTIADIAGECGYESLCSFNRNFKELVGMTPTQYRETQKSSQRNS